jgi:GNAT superfamily N-acetyltransferase
MEPRGSFVTAFEIRPMTPADLDAVGDMTAAGGFGDRRAFFREAVSLSNCRPIVAVEEGRPIGTGLGAVHGEVGWIGVIFVSPDLRRRGIGRALTEAVCDILEGVGCRSLILVATDMGRPLYERLGFSEHSRYHMHPGEPLDEAPTPPAGTSVRRVRAADLDAIAALDRQATSEDRRPLIEAHAGGGWLLQGGASEADLRGYLLPTHRGNAALIAPRPEDALFLLDLHRHLIPRDGRAWAGLLTENESGRQLLAERGWTEWRSFPRMIRGPEPEWKPAIIWGQFNHAMG